MINPIVVIIISAYILSFLVLRIVVKPKKPILTGALLIALILFVILTSMIDVAIYDSEIMHDFEKGLVSFVTATSISDTISLEKSFMTFAYFDIALFVIAITSMCIELRSILISVYSERKKLKTHTTHKTTKKA